MQASGVGDMSRVMRMIQLIPKTMMTFEELKKIKHTDSNLNSPYVKRQKATLELVQLSNELNGRVINLYA